MSVEEPQITSKTAANKGLLENMAPNIAIIVLFAYVVLLFLLTAISCIRSAEKEWMELTKTGFTTLGSALTLILGYYFGQKQVAEEAKRETEAASAQLAKEKQKTSQLVELAKSSPTPNDPDDLSELDQSRLQAGRPAGSANAAGADQRAEPSSSSSSSSTTL